MSILNSFGDPANPYQAFITKSRYARYIDEKNRRETWTEAVDRYLDFMVSHLQKKHGYVPSRALEDELRREMYEMNVLPSMRALWTAGPALEQSNVAGYNCSYLPIKDVKAFSEVLFILMNGTGVGYSVERRYVDQLPPVALENPDAEKKLIIVGDSKLGWAHAYRELLHCLWIKGSVPEWDLSQVRPKGARLKTFGGRASGPEPLDGLFRYTVDLLTSARGRKLRPIEVHDLLCHIAEIVQVGGVRRSAMIALSDLDDEEMATAKSGEWWNICPQRRFANISAVYEDGVSREDFEREWATLVASGSGERGIFNRSAARRQASRNGLRSPDEEYGLNPCAEIILKPYSFCNLSEVVARPDDTPSVLARKVELAAILGTWQSTLTDFPFLREEWDRNAEDERLLGVSITGIFDNAYLQIPGEHEEPDHIDLLEHLRARARAANAIEARKIGIPVSAAVTCVKPSGTASQAAGCSSGMHTWHDKYYKRNVRANKTDPIARMLHDIGVPCEDDVMDPENTWVFSFPVEAPFGAVTRNHITAIGHLNHWLRFRRHWCEHNPSVTVNVRPDEWDVVKDWVWWHINELIGVTFLPFDEHTYKQAPYEEIDYFTYRQLRETFPEIPWERLPEYEFEDSTIGSQELACSSGACDIADINPAS